MRLAIVGSTKFGAPEGLVLARRLIYRTLKVFEPEVVISGGADGVDTLAHEMADLLEIPFIEHHPKYRRWEPEGFRERNIIIAEDCTYLLAIRDRFSKTYGSGWTADWAEHLGKPVERFYL